MNKTLKFPAAYISAILEKDQVTTARMFDEKNLTEGDMVDFLNQDTGETFAQAKITRIKIMSFAEMASLNKDPEYTYQGYSERYHTEITPDMEVKLVTCDLLKGEASTIPSGQE